MSGETFSDAKNGAEPQVSSSTSRGRARSQVGQGAPLSRRAQHPTWRMALARLWAIPAVLGLVAALVVFFSATQTPAGSSSAIVNTRSASPLPNERSDLINDLSAVLKVSPVLEVVADEFDLDTADLRDGLRVTRIDSSTLVGIALTAEGDEELRRAVLARFLEATQDFLDPAGPSAAYDAALAAESKAIDDYYAALEQNGGRTPTGTLNRLRAGLLDAQASGDEVLERRLNARMPKATRDAAAFEKLETARERAISTLSEVAVSELASAGQGAGSLELTYLDGVDDGGSMARIRRAAASGAAVALVAAMTIVVLAGRRRKG
jgi:hypothetical protein